MSLLRNVKRGIARIAVPGARKDTGKYYGISDDVMFCSVMEDEEFCKEFLQRVLGVRMANIECIITQKSLKSRIKSRGVRLDVYARDVEGNSYDIEMQVIKELYIEKRTRYYHGEMDRYQLKKGQNYNQLGKNIVIFVCCYDPFGRDRSIYTFKKYCEEDKAIELKDDIVSIYLNVNGNRDNTETDLGNVLDYIKTGDSKDAFTSKIAAKVDELNDDDDWRDRRMTYQMKLDERYDAGYLKCAEEKDAVIKERDETIKGLDETIKELDETINEQGEVIKEKDETINERDETIRERDEEIKKLKAELQKYVDRRLGV